jgi:hypothetical protein
VLGEHPQPHARNKEAHEFVTTGSPERSGFPCTVVLTVSFVLASETGLVVSVISAMRKHCRRFDISVGISGPHDFAVRAGAVRLAAPHASIASRAQRP